MVVTAIFVILTGVVLANNTRFSNMIVLQNLAHDIALSIREAQVYGIAVRQCDESKTAGCADLTDKFDLAYGVHFKAGEPSFELFADINNSGAYDPGETVLATTIKSGYSVTSVSTENTQGALTTPTDLDIAFRRPEPDACIEGDFDEDGDCIGGHNRATIVVQSNSGITATIMVESTGQISVQ